MLSAENFANSSDPDLAGQSWAGSGSKLFETLVVFLKEIFKGVDFEKNWQTKSMKNSQ